MTDYKMEPIPEYNELLMISGMGTKLHGICSPSTFLEKSNSHGVGLDLKAADNRESFSNLLYKAGFWCGLSHLEGDMEKILDRNNKDFIRNKMVKQEEMFRYQVHELHRLYRVQRMMMADLRCKGVMSQNIISTSLIRITDKRSRQWSSASTSENSYSSHVSNINQGENLLQHENVSLLPVNTEAGPSLKELTTCTEDIYRVQKNFNLEQPPEENAATGARSSQDQIFLFGKQLKEKKKIEDSSLRPEDEAEIKLTLSIGR